MKISIRGLGVTSAIAVIAAIAALSVAALIHPINAAPAGDGTAGNSPMMNQPMQMPGHDQTMPGPGPMPGMMEHHQQMMQMFGQLGAQVNAATPTMPGQDAFGAVQEIVRILEADPKTDWSKVDLEALRQHLIDMSEVTLKADAVAKPIDGGLEIAITGSGRTLAAIERMIPAHAREINGLNGWSAKTEALSDGVRLTVTATDPAQAQHIRGLGFIGILVSGSHHQPHHLAMAKGEMAHGH